MQPKHIRIHKAVADQIKIVNYASQNSIHMAADKYAVERKYIRNCKKTVARVTKNVRQIYQSTYHHGGKSETDEVENEIVGWILINRSLGISVSSWEVIIKACSLNNTIKFKNIINLQKWCYKILYLINFLIKTFKKFFSKENFTQI